jgi:hypothetical protein
MIVHNRILLIACGLFSILSLLGFPALSFADDDDGPGNGQKVTICHIPSQGKMSPRTLRLPAHVAQGHLDAHQNDYAGECGGTKFAIVAVSGTLEEGFPLRPNLDFTTEVNEGNPPVLAIFLGRALVRGVKAFLDLKDSMSREFKPAGMLNPINPALVASGNNNDANISSIYLIDRRQALRALLNEPRYLSMVPDLAKVDIHAPETDQTVRQLILQAIEETPLAEPKNFTTATFLQVISTWKSCHFVESPLIMPPKADGTRVTDFPNSLAIWAGTTDAQRIVDPAGYNAAVEAKIRETLSLPAGSPGSDNCVDNPSTFPAPVAPDTLIRYAVDKHTKRMNDTYRPCEFEEFARRAGLNIQVPQCPN